MKLFIDRLVEKIKEKNSSICVGLDPHPDMLPEFLVRKYAAEFDNTRKAAARAVLEFNQNLLDSIHEITPAVKPQAAFYELLGLEGIKTLKKTIEYAKQKELLVILDAKRNDIGSTAAAYSRAYLGMEEEQGFRAGWVSEEEQEISISDSNKDFVDSNDSAQQQEKNVEIAEERFYFQNEIEVDCMTINPYLGADGIMPFLHKKSKGAFALLKTSNKSGGDIQDLELTDGSPVYERVAQLITEWGSEHTGKSGYSNLGAVVGATYPRELKKLRSMMPQTYFLIPGFGFQGGEPEDIVYGFNDDGRGAIVNSSRGINFAYQREPWKKDYSAPEYAAAARRAAQKMRDEINKLKK